MEKGRSSAPFTFADYLLFRIIVATRLVFTATAGYFNAVKAAVATFKIVLAVFYVALDRIVFVHNALLWFYYELFFDKYTVR